MKLAEGKNWHGILRRITAAIILALLLVTPFFNWRLGAFFWLGAMLFYVFQDLFGRRRRDAAKKPDDEKEDEDEGDS